MSIREPWNPGTLEPWNYLFALNLLTLSLLPQSFMSHQRREWFRVSSTNHQPQSAAAQARIILGQAELEIAESFRQAALSYHDNPTALHLRAMNMLYEGLKEKGALMLIPSSAVESMGMGGMLGAAALRQQKLTGGDRVD